MWLVSVIVVGTSLLLVGVLAFVRQPNRWSWSLYALNFGLAILFLWITAPWAMISLHFRTALPLLFIGACVIGYRRIRISDVPPPLWQLLIPALINGGFIALLLIANGYTLTGYATPDEVIDLASPLREGSYVVGHGGSSVIINAHALVNPQNFALDIVGVNAWGRSKSDGDDPVLEQYAIFGDTLYSPCDGIVTGVETNLPDLIPPERDTENLAGNYVLITCHGVEVILAHMKAGSVRVAVGDSITTADVLGQVGNSGNTSEPHLHIHAERGGTSGHILDGEAVPITLNGRFLVRNSRFRF